MPMAPAAAVSRTTMLAFSALGNTDALATSRRMSRPDIGLAMTPDRGVGHQPVAAHPPAVGVLLTHRPPCPPPSRVPSPGYAFPQPLTRVTIVI
jgi:hypothetical protein